MPLLGRFHFVEQLLSVPSFYFRSTIVTRILLGPLCLTWLQKRILQVKRITGTVYTEGDIEKSEHGKAPENPYCLHF